MRVNFALALSFGFACCCVGALAGAGPLSRASIPSHDPVSVSSQTYVRFNKVGRERDIERGANQWVLRKQQIPYYG